MPVDQTGLQPKELTMFKFANVFDSNGRQVLVMKNETTDEADNTVPKLSIIFHFDSGEQIDVGLVFKDSEAEWEKMDKAFDKFGQSEVDAITALLEDGMTPFDFIQKYQGRK